MNLSAKSLFGGLEQIISGPAEFWNHTVSLAVQRILALAQFFSFKHPGILMNLNLQQHKQFGVVHFIKQGTKNYSCCFQLVQSEGWCLNHLLMLHSAARSRPPIRLNKHVKLITQFGVSYFLPLHHFTRQPTPRVWEAPEIVGLPQMP